MMPVFMVEGARPRTRGVPQFRDSAILAVQADCKISKLGRINGRERSNSRRLHHSKPSAVRLKLPGQPMTRERFMKLVAQALDELPARFRERLQNVAILVEDVPPAQRRRGRPRATRPPARPRKLLMGVFVGVPATQKSVFQLPGGPDHVILYQKNIERVCTGDEDVREEIRLTLLHELGHYFGLSEEQLRDL